MAKVKINSLPPGFTIENGKIVKKMQRGGLTTGDQYGFGLTTNVKSPERENMERDINVRHSLNAVPRDEANIEAEGGETVLTDLNNDGLFGLYDIRGPRHSSGGVPLNLPEQSFVFSDTKDMKLGGADLQAFGIKSRKKMTPADVSKKYDLNQYYGAIKNEYADDIQVKSAELMMDKNKRSLSKLAFVQESKKDFMEGVPAAAYPYLISQGIDPIDFTARVEQLSRQRAQEKVINSLPPQQRAQLMMLQEILAQVPGEEIITAKYGMELPKLQKGNGEQPSNQYKAFDPNAIERYRNLGIGLNIANVGESAYESKQKETQLPGRYGEAGKNEQGFIESWRGIYPDIDQLINSLSTYKPDKKESYKNPEVLRFQDWFNNEYIPQEVNRINATRKDAGYAELTDQEKVDLTTDLRKDFGFGQGTGKDFDGKFGTVTSSRRPLTYTVQPQQTSTQQGCPCEDGTYSESCCEKRTIPQGELGKIRENPKAELWLQDLLQLNAIANRDREMFFPFQPAVTPIDMGYVLEEPTRAIAAINEQLGIQTQAFGAFGGPQALAARNAQAQAQAANAIANEVARVNQRNVSTINQGLAQQAQMNAYLDAERRERVVREYDDTQTVLQRYMDEKNYDREQYTQALTNALTNRANTYNLNSIQDYYQIDPSTGGMIGQFSGKAFEPAPQADPYANVRQYAELARLFKAAGIEPTAELIQGAIGVPYTQMPQETNAARAMRTSPYYGYNAPMSQPQGKKGKEIKSAVVPFYMGRIGG